MSRHTAIGRRSVLGLGATTTLATIMAATPASSALAQVTGAAEAHVRLVDTLDPAQLAAWRSSGRVTGCVAPLRRALAYLSAMGGGTVTIDAGTFKFDSRALGNRGIALPANCRIVGAGPNATTLVVTGHRAARFLVGTAGARIGVSDLKMVGNSLAPVETVGGALFVKTPPNRADSGIVIERVALENFAGAGWIHIVAGASAVLSNVTVQDCTARSRPGNSPRPDAIAENSTVIRIQGGAGSIENVRISRIEVDARYIKGGVTLFDDIRGATLEDCRITAAGQQGARDNAAAYAILLYDRSHRQRDITVLRAQIDAPRSCGIYAAGVNRLAVLGTRVTGQTDRSRSGLPKGGVVFNGVVDGVIARSTFINNINDIGVVPRSRSNDLNIMLRDCEMRGSTGAAVLVTMAGKTGRWLGFTMEDCRIQSRGRGFALIDSARAGIEDMSLVRTSFSTGHFGIDLFMDAPTGSSGIDIRAVTIAAARPALRARDRSGPLTLADSDLRSARGTTAFDARGLDQLALDNVGFSGLPRDFERMGSVLSKRSSFRQIRRLDPAS